MTDRTSSRKSPRKQDSQRLGRGLSSLLGDSPIQAATEGSSHTVNAIRHDADNAGRDIRALPIEWIVPGPWQPRRNFDSDELKELAVSIKSRGLLQPVIVRPHPDRNSQYQLIAGERRWRASQMASLHQIPAIISNFVLSTFDFLTMIGCIIPLSLIELVNSSKEASSKIFLG